MGFLGALTLLLVAAKLFGTATYGWLVALSPMIGCYAISIAMGVVNAIIESRNASKMKQLRALMSGYEDRYTH